MVLMSSACANAPMYIDIVERGTQVVILQAFEEWVHYKEKKNW